MYDIFFCALSNHDHCSYLIYFFTFQNEEDKRVLREMYQEWPWFREIISLISMLISKTDFSITKVNFCKYLPTALTTNEVLTL